MIKFLLSNLYDTINGAKKAVAVIIVSVSVTTAVILAFVSMLSESVVSIKGFEYDSRFYSVPVASSYSLPRMEAVDDLLFGEYPKIKEVYPFSVASYELTDDFSIATGGGQFAAQTEFDGYPVVDLSFCPFLYIPSPNVIEGRWFTKQEILDGDDVVVLSRPWLEENYAGSVPNVNDTFEINGALYTIVGITDGVDKTLEEFVTPKPNYIPYRALSRHETDNSGFKIAEYQIFIEFEKPLTTDQRMQIARSFADESNLRIPMSNIDVSGSGYLISALLILAIAIVMILVCALNIIGLYQSVLKTNIYRYMVYKVCGATNRAIGLAMRSTTACFTVASATAGCALYLIVSKLIPSAYLPLELTWYSYPVVVLTMTISMQIIINPMIRSISERQPIDRRLWR